MSSVNAMLFPVDISDYIGVSMQFTITGTESVSVPVNITNDQTQEGGENFFGNLAAWSGAANFTNIMFDPILATANIADGNDDWEGGRELGEEEGVYRKRRVKREGMEGGG